MVDIVAGTYMEKSTVEELDKLYKNGEISGEQLANLKQIYGDEFEKELRKTDHLWELANEHIMPMIHCATSIYLTLDICGNKIDCLLDTGAELNVISEKLVKKLNLESFVDTTYKAEIIGVGTSKSIGKIPYLEVKLGNVECAIYFSVVDNAAGKDIILGMPFMLFYQVQLDFKNRCLQIMGTKVDFKIVNR